MKPPGILMIDGHAYSWQRFFEICRRQPEERRKVRPDQPAMSEMRCAMALGHEPSATWPGT